MILLIILSVVSYMFGMQRAGFLAAGFAAQSAYLLLRGMHLGRLPLVGPHDTLFFLSASLMLFSIPIAWKMKTGKTFLNAAAGMAVLFIMLSLLFRPHEAPLPPVLRTFWFETHVAFSFFSYALFGIGAVLAVIQLLPAKESPATPPLHVTAALQYKVTFIGYLLFSAAMICGGIWAYLAWGTYWLWTPKELWTTILWLFYSLLLHARLLQWWSGRPSAVLGIAGFLIVMFTYLGVSLLMKSSHTF